MPIELKPNEVRVLGVLIEKSMTTPESYPMTINAITQAANQKTNRDPVLSLSEGEVSAALHGLQQWQLVTQAEPDRGSRVNRFQHQVEKRFGWNAAQRAIMAELLLRGPQTLGEIRMRASRMTRLEAIDYASELIDELRQSDPPMVVELPRDPGKAAVRYAQLLGGPVKAAPDVAAAAAAPVSRETGAGNAPDLERRVACLEADVRWLKERLGAGGPGAAPADPVPAD